MSPEAIRRILKSRWRPTPEEQVDRINRWNKWHQRGIEKAIRINTFRTKSTALQGYRIGHYSPMPIQTNSQFPLKPNNKTAHKYIRFDISKRICNRRHSGVMA